MPPKRALGPALCHCFADIRWLLDSIAETRREYLLAMALLASKWFLLAVVGSYLHYYSDSRLNIVSGETFLLSRGLSCCNYLLVAEAAAFSPA